jgi:uncharacterized membrane protein
MRQEEQVPVQVVVAGFNREDGGSQALGRLKAMAKEKGLVGIANAAVLSRDQSGELHVQETHDMRTGKGAAIGGTVGAVAGLLVGPVGWAALGGAAIGGLAAKLRDSGFPDERLREIGQALTPGTSALIAVVEHQWVAEAEKQLTEQGADVLTEAVRAEVAAQLDKEAVGAGAPRTGPSNPGSTSGYSERD